MKKALLLLMVAALLFSMVACGSEPVDTTETTTVNDVETTTADDTDVTTGADASATGNNTTASQQSGNKTSAQNTTTTTKTTRASIFSTKFYKKNNSYIEERGGMKNTGYKIAVENNLTVAFMGASVTEGMGSDYPTGSISGGWRGRLMKYLKENYNATFTDVPHVLGGNGSRYGVYAVNQYVATKKPDLVFIDYSVSNGYDKVDTPEVLWNHYETLIHTIRNENPYADIVLVHVSDRSNEAKDDVIPVVEQIAEKYQLTSVHLYKAIEESLQKKGYTWDVYYKNKKGEVDSVHPNGDGYDVMAEVMKGLIEYSLSVSPYSYQKMSTPAPKATLQTEANVFLMSSVSNVAKGWSYKNKFVYAGDTKHYNGCWTTTEGETITIKFKGNYFGVLVEFGPDCGTLEYRIDNTGSTKTLDCNNSFANPETRLFLEDAEYKEHTVTLRLRPQSGKHLSLAALVLNGQVISVS